MGLAVNKALTSLIDIKTGIKWPNDIVLNNKKVCGILSEIAYKNNEIDYIVLGVGINLYTEKFDDEIEKIATSVFLETGKKIDKFELLSEILNQFEPLYYEYLKNGMKNIINDYKMNCVTLDKEVLIIRDNLKYSAYAKDITIEGELLVDFDGKKEIIKSGEVSVRGLFGYI
jgi:BirA family biotin operon repressor/biotin-[acetyl-CoA-carboxylase] ligase